MSYFVLLLNATNMEGNPFLNFFLITAIEVPAFASGKVLGYILELITISIKI